MDVTKAINLMKIEKECVERQDTDKCVRETLGCYNCDLVQDKDEIIEAYNIIIKFFEKS